MYIFKQSHTLTFGVKYNESSCTKKKLININNNVFTVTKGKMNGEWLYSSNKYYVI